MPLQDGLRAFIIRVFDHAVDQEQRRRADSDASAPFAKDLSQPFNIKVFGSEEGISGPPACRSLRVAERSAGAQGRTCGSGRVRLRAMKTTGSNDFLHLNREHVSTKPRFSLLIAATARSNAWHRLDFDKHRQHLAQNERVTTCQRLHHPSARMLPDRWQK